jgi:hypothetical protein
LAAVERRHSASPAASTRALGRSSRPRASTKRSIFSAREKSRSNCALPRAMRLIFSQWPMMIAQVTMLARISPTITALTTISACRNKTRGDIRPLSPPAMISSPTLTP